MYVKITSPGKSTICFIKERNKLAGSSSGGSNPAKSRADSVIALLIASRGESVGKTTI
ncbi:hypothetical protein QA597_00275 [Marinilabiliaceae bacterium ANBcel2]|nr:hypothetical protein [Marinilabiliaceae bacterium ANBcel2]